MKKQTKIIKGIEVVLTKSKACNKCVFFDDEGMCISEDIDCLFIGNKDYVWTYAHPWKECLKKIKLFFQNPVTKYFLVLFGFILILLLIMAGESIIEYFLMPLKK